MSSLVQWIKVTDGVRHALVVEVKDRKVIMDVDLFSDLMNQLGWRATDVIEDVSNGPHW